MAWATGGSALASQAPVKGSGALQRAGAMSTPPAAVPAPSSKLPPPPPAIRPKTWGVPSANQPMAVPGGRPLTP